MTLLARALRRRCPNCGSGPVFRKWLHMDPVCKSCGLQMDRGEHDYFLGGYLLNFIVAELIICLGALIGIILTYPDVPWMAIQVYLLLLMFPAPVLTYPYAKTLWLAVDIMIRPVTLSDLEGHGEIERAAPISFPEAIGLSRTG